MRINLQKTFILASKFKMHSWLISVEDDGPGTNLTEEATSETIC